MGIAHAYLERKYVHWSTDFSNFLCFNFIKNIIDNSQKSWEKIYSEALYIVLAKQKILQKPGRSILFLN